MSKDFGKAAGQQLEMSAIGPARGGGDLEMGRAASGSSTQQTFHERHYSQQAKRETVQYRYGKPSSCRRCMRTVSNSWIIHGIVLLMVLADCTLAVFTLLTHSKATSWQDMVTNVILICFGVEVRVHEKRESTVSHVCGAWLAMVAMPVSRVVWRSRWLHSVNSDSSAVETR